MNRPAPHTAPLVAAALVLDDAITAALDAGPDANAATNAATQAFRDAVAAYRAALAADSPPGEQLVQPTVEGKPFRCECGGNVLRKNGSIYTCSACGAEYEGTPPEDRAREHAHADGVKHIHHDSVHPHPWHTQPTESDRDD